MGRRKFLRHAAAAISGCFPLRARPCPPARNAVFVLMAGAPSQTDTFDLKEGPWTPPFMKPTSHGDIRFPRGLMPYLADTIGDLALVRSITSPSVEHRRAQTQFNHWLGQLPGFTALNAAGDFGDACVFARHLLRADGGGRLIQIRFGNWDHHGNIYEMGRHLQLMAGRFDAGLGRLIADLKKDGLLDSTLIVAVGEFGRSVGPLNQNRGRDHHPVHAALFAGGCVRGGRAIGRTNALGDRIADPGWSQKRPVSHQDIAATIYSALGIDTGFFSDGRPVNELWERE